MKNTIKKILPKTVKDFLSDNLQVAKWIKNGKPMPAPKLVKQKMLANYADKYNCKILVETGTYKGEMVFSQLNNFKQIFSIELSEELFKDAKKRFINNEHVKLLNGDSAIKLSEIINKLNEKSLFWLDAHYSGGVTALGNQITPIYDELEIIFKNNLNHIILIDDARLFIGADGYPSLTDLISFIKKSDKEYEINIKNDIIILTK